MSQKGTVLVETLIALGTAVIIIAAITIMVVSALNNAQTAKTQDTATQSAQEGLEIVRNITKTNWTYFYSLNDVTYCLLPDSTEITTQGVEGCKSEASSLVRSVRIEHDNTQDCSGASKVIVSVAWSDSDCPIGDTYCHSVPLESCFSNSEVIPSP